MRNFKKILLHLRSSQHFWFSALSSVILGHVIEIPTCYIGFYKNITLKRTVWDFPQYVYYALQDRKHDCSLVSSCTVGGGEIAAWLRRYWRLVDWIRDFDQLWEMSGQTKWQTHPSVPLLFALPDLSFSFPFYQCWCSQSVTVIASQHYTVICLNWAIMRLVNLILSQNQINPVWQDAHMCLCTCEYVCIVRVYSMLAKTFNPRSVCWINQGSIFESDKSSPFKHCPWMQPVMSEPSTWTGKISMLDTHTHIFISNHVAGLHYKNSKCFPTEKLQQINLTYNYATVLHRAWYS